MKRLFKYILIVLSVFMLGGCGAPALSDNYNEDKLKNVSDDIISNLSNEKYEYILDSSNDELKKQLSTDKLKKAWLQMKNYGKYKSISKITFQEKDGFAVVTIIATYDKGTHRFRLSYDKNIKLAGIYFLV